MNKTLDNSLDINLYTRIDILINKISSVLHSKQFVEEYINGRIDNKQFLLKHLKILIESYTGKGVKADITISEFVYNIFQNYASEDKFESIIKLIQEEIDWQKENNSTNDENSLEINENSWLIRLIKSNLSIKKEDLFSKYIMLNNFFHHFYFCKGKIPSNLCKFSWLLLFNIITTMIFPFGAILEFCTSKRINDYLWNKYNIVFHWGFWFILYMYISLSGYVILKEINITESEILFINILYIIGLGALISIIIIRFIVIKSIVFISKIKIPKIYKDNKKYKINSKNSNGSKKYQFLNLIKERYKSWKYKYCPTIKFKN